MNQLRNYLTRAFLLLFVLITGYISIFTFKEWTHAGYIYSLLPGAKSYLFLGAGAVFIAVLCGVFLYWSQKFSDRHMQLFTIVTFVILFAGQLLLILGIGQSTFMYDPYRVFDEAIHMLKTHTVSGTVMDGYYGIYPNNISFTLICYWILKLASCFGLTDTGLMLFLQIVNALCMDLGIYFMYQLMNNWCSKRAAGLFLFVCLLNPLVYIWPGFAYTSTFSMPFISGFLYVFLKILHTDQKKSRVIYGIVSGILLVLGFKIRATVFISLIAAVIYLILGFANKIKRHLSGILIFCLSFVLGLGAWGMIQNHYVMFDSTDTAFPVISWLAMGASYETDGMFNTQDYYDTKNAATAAEKKAVNEQKLKERLQSLGITGYIRLAGNKMVRTWADGTDDYVSYLNQYPDTGKLHTYLLETKKDFVVSYMQMMRCFLFLCTFLGALYMLFSHSFNGTVILLQLNLLGGTFFHILWETGELYSLCFSFLLFALACIGYEQLTEKASGQKIISNYVPAVLMFLLTVYTAAWCVSHNTEFTQTIVKKHDTLISQKTYTSSEQSGLTKGNVLQQTFYADKPFNRVCVRVKNAVPENKDSAYHVTVTSETGDLLLDTRVSGHDVFDYDYFYFGLAEEETPAGMSEYTITITCEKGAPRNSIVFLRYDTGNHDAYTPGALYENDHMIQNADLNFMVYRSYQDTYFSPQTWRILCTGLIGMQVILCICLTADTYSSQKKRKHL